MKKYRKCPALRHRHFKRKQRPVFLCTGSSGGACGRRGRSLLGEGRSGSGTRSWWSRGAAGISCRSGSNQNDPERWAFGVCGSSAEGQRLLIYINPLLYIMLNYIYIYNPLLLIYINPFHPTGPFLAPKLIILYVQAHTVYTTFN